MELFCYLIIEEMYELVDVIMVGDFEFVKGEIGDLMLYMVFYVKIGVEKKVFDIIDVFYGICDKFVYCYLYIYGDV